MKIIRIELQNWKNFTQADVDLADRVFIVGPNAAGKSSFLDVFQFLHDLVIEGGGLAQAVEKRGGVSAIRSLHARAQSNISIEITVQSDAQERWKYLLSFTHFSARNSFTPIIRKEEVIRIGVNGEEKVVSRPNEEDKNDKESLTQTYLQQLPQNQSFRDLYHFFKDIQYIHLVPQLLRDSSFYLPASSKMDFLGRDLLDRIRQTPKNIQKARLKRITKTLKGIVPHFEGLESVDDRQGTPHLQIRFRHWRPNGGYQYESQFSDGTLRLIGLFWVLLETGGVLLLEEPELSLHTAIVRRLASFIYSAQKKGGKQVILSTHSESLLSDEGIEPEEILIITPDKEGSKISVGAHHIEVCRLMQSGIPPSEAVLPRTETEQMKLFGEYDL